MFLLFFSAPIEAPRNLMATASGPHSILARWQVYKTYEIFVAVTVNMHVCGY